MLTPVASISDAVLWIARPPDPLPVVPIVVPVSLTMPPVSTLTA
jgi:hypothetical protein